jgi:hypothetical protein
MNPQEELLPLLRIEVLALGLLINKAPNFENLALEVSRFVITNLFTTQYSPNPRELASSDASLPLIKFTSKKTKVGDKVCSFPPPSFSWPYRARCQNSFCFSLFSHVRLR